MTEAAAGILRVDKPEGPTSHDIVARARRALGTRRVGHTGTLDPFASGLLLLLTGVATRLSEVLTGLPKEYEAEALLGVRTTTDDREGDPVKVAPGADALTLEVVGAAVSGFLGPQLQRPPAFSAKKLGGEAAHRKARRGEAVDLAPVPVEIHRIELLDWSPPHLRFRVVCSSGTYIRAIARDLGEALGVGGHLTGLRRTAIGSQRVEGALPGDRLDDVGARASAWLPLQEALGHLPVLQIDADAVARIRMGQTIPAPDGDELATDPTVALFQGPTLVALAERRGLWLHPRRVLVES